ncbi:MAG: nucleotide excision repair endonuclease [Candidatus Marinimicrobia bacterium]|nr:nucleotide excision repair endonuclease [Candidatus Neomarinimicrobiota bacterium]MCF7839897.1 nucleotide excision repair endonuclease [Candidatus Neomarinimicrobiota bacterium]MCF7902838.1 nucleotide excision repair endonuclease [Candidatus Neomarinimicrobiota bacterium]
MPRLHFPGQMGLFQYENPLKERIGTEWFKALPNQPGVYLMWDQDDRLLYVGKAKDLKARLMSYQRARPNDAPRKVIRLIHRVRKITYELCESEEAALLRENALLREHQPPFNVQNTRPEWYAYVGLEADLHHITLAVEESVDEHPEFEYFGAFKGRAFLQRRLQAVMRWLWFIQHPDSTFVDFPTEFTRENGTQSFTIELIDTPVYPRSRRWDFLLTQYFRGTAQSFQVRCMDYLSLAKDAFVRGILSQDLERLMEFYQFGPYRIHRLKRHFNLTDNTIPREKLDDYIVSFRQQFQTIV